MSRVANSPVVIPSGVTVDVSGSEVTVKGAMGSLQHTVHPVVEVKQEDGRLQVAARNASKPAVALAGTSRAILNNMVQGVSSGFEKRLQINGVGYRAQLEGKRLNLTLGFSHPINFEVPDAVTIETPSPTEIIVKGVDKQSVGQVAANIRGYRPPEPYKGKGVRYADEHVTRKEAKKT